MQCIHTNMHTYTDRQAGRQAGRQADRQTDRQTHLLVELLVEATKQLVIEGLALQLFSMLCLQLLHSPALELAELPPGLDLQLQQLELLLLGFREVRLGVVPR